MENIIPIAIALLIMLAALIIYFWRRKTVVQDAKGQVNHQEEPAEEEDIYEKFMPHVTEVQSEETAKDNYRKFEIPFLLKMDLEKTLSAGHLVIEDYKTYKVKFSPEVIKGLKDKSMNLIPRTDGNGYLPAVRKEGVKGIYKQGVLLKKANPALVANASLSLLTAVVGQQQLVEIQSSLKEIERKLAFIMKHRNNDFAGRIESRFSYFTEVIERFRRKGILLSGVEDHKIEGLYADTLQDMKVLMKDLSFIGESIEELKEYEHIRKLGEAPVKKEFKKLIEQFNEKQELIQLNVKFIQECYEPYLSTVRDYPEETVKSRTLADLIIENNAIIEQIGQKAKSIEENYKVKINFGIKAIKYRNLKSLKELSPAKISHQGPEAQKVPTEILIETTEDNKIYAYVEK